MSNSTNDRFEGMSLHERLIALDKEYGTPTNSPLHHNNRHCDCQEEEK